MTQSDGCQKPQELSEQYELGDNLIICLDSDFSYIRSVLNFPPEDSHDRDYIFETYSHSIENAKYYEDFIVNQYLDILVKTHIQKSLILFMNIIERYRKFIFFLSIC